MANPEINQEQKKNSQTDPIKNNMAPLPEAAPQPATALEQQTGMVMVNLNPNEIGVRPTSGFDFSIGVGGNGKDLVGNTRYSFTPRVLNQDTGAVWQQFIEGQASGNGVGAKVGVTYYQPGLTSTNLTASAGLGSKGPEASATVQVGFNTPHPNGFQPSSSMQLSASVGPTSSVTVGFNQFSQDPGGEPVRNQNGELVPNYAARAGFGTSGPIAAVGINTRSPDGSVLHLSGGVGNAGFASVVTPPRLVTLAASVVPGWQLTLAGGQNLAPIYDRWANKYYQVKEEGGITVINGIPLPWLTVEPGQADMSALAELAAGAQIVKQAASRDSALEAKIHELLRLYPDARIPSVLENPGAVVAALGEGGREQFSKRFPKWGSSFVDPPDPIEVWEKINGPIGDDPDRRKLVTEVLTRFALPVDAEALEKEAFNHPELFTPELRRPTWIKAQIPTTTTEVVPLRVDVGDNKLLPAAVAISGVRVQPQGTDDHLGERSETYQIARDRERNARHVIRVATLALPQAEESAAVYRALKPEMTQRAEAARQPVYNGVLQATYTDRVEDPNAAVQKGIDHFMADGGGKDSGWVEVPLGMSPEEFVKSYEKELGTLAWRQYYQLSQLHALREVLPLAIEQGLVAPETAEQNQQVLKQLADFLQSPDEFYDQEAAEVLRTGVIPPSNPWLTQVLTEYAPLLARADEIEAAPAAVQGTQPPLPSAPPPPAGQGN